MTLPNVPVPTEVKLGQLRRSPASQRLCSTLTKRIHHIKVPEINANLFSLPRRLLEHPARRGQWRRRAELELPPLDLGLILPLNRRVIHSYWRLRSDRWWRADVHPAARRVLLAHARRCADLEVLPSDADAEACYAEASWRMLQGGGVDDDGRGAED